MSLGRVLTRQLSQITDQIFLTGAAGVSDTVMLQDAKITHVLNLAEELSTLTYPDGIRVKFVKLRDTENQSLLPYLEELVEHIHQVVNSGGKLAVHCVAGVSRSASTVIAYLVKHKDMTLRQAHDHVKVAREVISPNIGFWAALVEYEMEIRGSNSVELLPFVAGTIPSVDSYRQEMMYRIRLGWMDHIFYNILSHALILFVQLVGTHFIYNDF